MMSSASANQPMPCVLPCPTEKSNSGSAASASTMPSAPAGSARSRSIRNDITMVMAGDNEMIGKMKYAGPMVSALNSSIWPPAPNNPMVRPYAMARGETSSFQPLRASTNTAGGTMVSDHTQYT